jgi:CHAD domain-containing protein
MSVYQKQIHNLLSKTARQLARAASNPQPRNVHRLRTSIRRVEAVLEELIPDPDRNQRKLLKLLTRLRRRAGRVRDLDVQIAALRNLKVSDIPGRKAQILSSFSELRLAREGKLRKALDRSTVQELRKRLKRVDRNLSTLIHEDFLPPLPLALRMFERLAAKNQTLSETSLHQYRIEGKRARYIAELAGDLPEAQTFVAHLKRMQDVLGEWHDWLTLAQSVAQISISSADSPLLAALQNIARAKFREAIQVVSATRLAILPQTARSDQLASSRTSSLTRRPVSGQPFAAKAVA